MVLSLNPVYWNLYLTNNLGVPGINDISNHRYLVFLFNSVLRLTHKKTTKIPSNRDSNTARLSTLWRQFERTYNISRPFSQLSTWINVVCRAVSVLCSRHAILWWEHLVVCSLRMKHTRVVSLNARQAKPGVHLVDTTRVCFIVNEHTTSVPVFITHAKLKCEKYIHLCDGICVWFHLKVGN